MKPTYKMVFRKKRIFHIICENTQYFLSIKKCNPTKFIICILNIFENIK